MANDYPVAPGKLLLVCFFQVQPGKLRQVRQQLEEALREAGLINGDTTFHWYYGLYMHELVCLMETDRLYIAADIPFVDYVKKTVISPHFMWVKPDEEGPQALRSPAASRDDPLALLVHCKIENDLLLQYGVAAERAVAKTLIDNYGESGNAYVLGGFGWNDLLLIYTESDLSALLMGEPPEAHNIWALTRDEVQPHIPAWSDAQDWFQDTSNTVFSRTYTLAAVDAEVVEKGHWDRIEGTAPPARLELRALTGRMADVAQAVDNTFHEFLEVQPPGLRDEIGEIDASVNLEGDRSCTSAKLLRCYFEGLLDVGNRKADEDRPVSLLYRAWLRLQTDANPDERNIVKNYWRPLNRFELDPPSSMVDLLQAHRPRALASLRTIYRLYNGLARNHSLYIYALLFRPALLCLGEQMDGQALQMLASKRQDDDMPPWQWREELRRLDQAISEAADLTEEVVALYSAHSYGLMSETPEPLPGHCICAQRLLVALFGIASAVVRSGGFVSNEEETYAFVMWVPKRWPIPSLGRAPIGPNVAHIPETDLLSFDDALFSVAHEAGHALVRRSESLGGIFQGALREPFIELERQCRLEPLPCIDQNTLMKAWRTRWSDGLEEVFGDLLAYATVCFRDIREVLLHLDYRGVELLGTAEHPAIRRSIPAIGRAFYVWLFDRECNETNSAPHHYTPELVRGLFQTDYFDQLRAIADTTEDSSTGYLCASADRTIADLPEANDPTYPWWLTDGFVRLCGQMLTQVSDALPDWRRDLPEGHLELARQACRMIHGTKASLTRQDEALSVDSVIEAYDAGLKTAGLQFEQAMNMEGGAAGDDAQRP